MRRFVMMAAACLALVGCGNQGQVKDDVARLKQENADLKARVTVLEGKVEALTASLPDSDLPSDDPDSPAK